MNNLFVFDPYHELALANNTDSFVAKKNAVALAHQLNTLPVYIEDRLLFLESEINNGWEKLAKKLGIEYGVTDRIYSEKIEKIEAWGWNRYIVKQLLDNGFNPLMIPDAATLEKIRVHSHRKFAIETLRCLKKNLGLKIDLGKEAKSLNSIKLNIELNEGSALKSPYSTSGKGVYFVHNKLNHSIEGWCKRVIEQQKSVIVEKRYEVLLNFACLFKVHSLGCDFVGYSMFETNGKNYKNNILLPDNRIEEAICEHISLYLLKKVKQELCSLLSLNLSSFYSGFLGVDMFVYNQNGGALLHPCVEINLRPTMGLVANCFFKKYVNPNKKGIFSVEYYSKAEELQQTNLKNTDKYPLVIDNGKIESGYISLCPIFANTQYLASATIDNF